MMIPSLDSNVVLPQPMYCSFTRKSGHVATRIRIVDGVISGIGVGLTRLSDIGINVQELPSCLGRSSA